MANKFNLDVDPVAVVCQAKDIVKRAEEIYRSTGSVTAPSDL
jgi:hypothetical protein